jgi:ABC-type lipoprotein release transport system permease subunit
MYLSAQRFDEVAAVAMRPTRYRVTGYDYSGAMLNESANGDFLIRLASVPTGVIISKDIADVYELASGDSLRAFVDIQSEQLLFVFTVVAVVEALTNCRYIETGIEPTGSQIVGSRTIWINREYVEMVLNVTEDARNVLCVRTKADTNGTELVDEIFGRGGAEAVRGDNWAAVSHEVDVYVSSASYRVDRGVDNMMMVVMVGVVVGSFTVYGAEGIRERRREIALLRSMGADSKIIAMVEAAELFVLLLFGSLLLFAYGPFLFSITMLTYQTTYYIFPVRVFPVIPWMLLLSILAFFVVSLLIFILGMSTLGLRINLSSALNSAWTESGPSVMSS